MKHYQITAQGLTAHITLIGDISWWSNSGADFTKAIDQLIEQGVTTVTGYIKSGGGDVIEANEIINQLRRIPVREKVVIGAICASAATAIANEFDEIEIAENGQYMIHNMYGGVAGTEKDIQSYLSLMKNLRENYVKNLSKRTKLSEAEIQTMMDETTWMSATVAKEKGFVTSITGEDKDTSIFNSIKNFGYKNIPVSVKNLIDNTPPKNLNSDLLFMKQRIIAALALGLEMKLNPDTADDTLAVHVEKMAQELISNKAELAKVKKETAEAKADIFVANLIEAKKITEEEAPQVKKDAIENYDLTARIYNKIPGVQKASQGINQQLGAEATDKRNWTFKDYQEKDSKGLLEMREKNKPLYMKLYEAHYGRPCVIAD